MSPRLSLFLASLYGFLAVGFGAFAAHGMSDPAAKALLDAGSRYEFVHALALIGCALLAERAPLARIAALFFALGVALFSFSLYALAFGAPRVVGAITPFGGVSFLIGWAMLGVAALRWR